MSNTVLPYICSTISRVVLMPHSLTMYSPRVLPYIYVQHFRASCSILHRLDFWYFEYEISKPWVLTCAKGEYFGGCEKCNSPIRTRTFRYKIWCLIVLPYKALYMFNIFASLAGIFHALHHADCKPLALTPTHGMAYNPPPRIDDWARGRLPRARRRHPKVKPAPAYHVN